MVRYYGLYSNVGRGKRKKNEQDELIPSILEPYVSSGGIKTKLGPFDTKDLRNGPLDVFEMLLKDERN